ncbi:MAG: hypothetical protein RQ966_19955 [Acetobacteraceae bacterium]|nr:hypothetical protein [Acetobacteraceae bacterium]
MRIRDALKLATGAALLASLLYVLMAAPGVLSDRDSVVPLGTTREALR